MAAGDSIQFVIDDASVGGAVPVVQVTIAENVDGTVTFDIVQLMDAGNWLGDLRGFFFDFVDETVLGGLSLVSATKTLADGDETSVGGSVAWARGNDIVKSAGGSSNNMNGLLGGADTTEDANNSRGYDFGIEIGKHGIGREDDVRAFSFTLGGRNPLTVGDFSNVDFGVRIQSVGRDDDGNGDIDTARDGTVKIQETLTAAETTTFSGSTDDQVITLGLGANRVLAGSGDDIIHVQMDAGPDVIDGGADNDLMEIQGRATDETYTIALYLKNGLWYAGIDAQSTSGNEISTINVEEIVLIAGDGADMFYLQGDLSLAGVAQGTVIVFGGGGDDYIDATGLLGNPPVRVEIHGEAGNDTLVGGASGDVLAGGAGNDILDGGESFDAVVYRDDIAGVNVNLAAGIAAGADSGTDTLLSIEAVLGGSGNDTIIGNSGLNTINGGPGDDILNGGAGGSDFVNYAGATSGVTVNLSISGPQAVGGGQGTDTLTGFRNITGSDFDDILTGDSNNNGLRGGGGDDIMDGGGGIDGAIFDSAPATLFGVITTISVTSGVTANLATGTATGLSTGTDTLISIENLSGTPFGDSFIGDANANRLTGRDGSDTLTGGAGADTFAYMSATEGADTITDFKQGGNTDIIDLAGLYAGVLTFENNLTPAVDPGVTAHRVTWYESGGNTIVQADTTGDAVVDFAITLLGTSLNLIATDFVL